jgi:AmmeMemoRadiSam system protein A
MPKRRYLYKPLGVFVTLNKNKQLRGCIGQFEPEEPLYKVIQDTAIDAALNDSRFEPVAFSELKDIEIEISIMTPKVVEDSWQDIELGKHGVVIQKGNRSGTFLPQVATDTGWSKEEFLSELCSQKAGLLRDCYQDPSVTIYTFQAQVFSENEN